MTISEFNILSKEAAVTELMKCCGSTTWAEALTESRPISSANALLELSDKIWFDLEEADWKEAFTHHPKIGDLKSLETKFASTKMWASGEQASINTAAHDTLVKLVEGNKTYEDKFGYIYIICATGKTADEMLTSLLSRLKNDAETELKIAAGEQNRITHLRIQKLLA